MRLAASLAKRDRMHSAEAARVVTRSRQDVKPTCARPCSTAAICRELTAACHLRNHIHHILHDSKNLLRCLGGHWTIHNQCNQWPSICAGPHTGSAAN